MSDAVEVSWKADKARFDLSNEVPETDEERAATPDHELDNEENREALNKMEAWRQQSIVIQSENRLEMATDEDFKDGLQWTDEERYELEVIRSQPAMVFNLVGTTVRWITGTQKRSRVDFKASPRGKEDVKSSEAKTHLLKYIMDANRGQFRVSEAFAKQVTAGLGWVETTITDDPSRETIVIRTENWRNVRYDPNSTEADLSDSRYLFRERWVDTDIAIKKYPERAHEIRRASENQTKDYWLSDEEFSQLHNKEMYPSVVNFAINNIESMNAYNQRPRVKLIECQYREWGIWPVLKGNGPWNGVIYNEKDPVLKWAVDSGEAEIVNSFRKRMMIAIYVDGAMIAKQVSPFWHNDFTLTPFWGWRRAKDNAPYGVVRDLRDPQSDLNKRRSKALHILSTKQIIADANAVDDWDEAVEEVSRPDGVIKKRPNSEFEIVQDKTLAEEHVMLMQHDEKMIQAAGGVTDENMGRRTNAVSGKAIEARQDQGASTTADLFDNLRLGFQLMGEKTLSLAEQYYDETKVIRIMGKDGAEDFLTINEESEEGIMNPIYASKADFRLDEQAYRDTTRQAMYEVMMEMITRLAQVNPGVALNLLDLAVESSDIPQRDAFVARIRKMTGQLDPTAAQDPKVLEAEQQAKAQQQQDQRREVEAKLAEMEGKAKEAMAKGDRVGVMAMADKLKAMMDGFELAMQIEQAPALATLADDLVEDAARGLPANNIPQQQPGG